MQPYIAHHARRQGNRLKYVRKWFAFDMFQTNDRGRQIWVEILSCVCFGTPVPTDDVLPVAGPFLYLPTLACFASHPGRLPSANQSSLALAAITRKLLGAGQNVRVTVGSVAMSTLAYLQVGAPARTRCSGSPRARRFFRRWFGSRCHAGPSVIPRWPHYTPHSI